MPNNNPDGGDSITAELFSRILADAEVRETGGEEGNEGVDFARYWAVSALIEKELEGSDNYVILFEFLQDVAILDSALDPKSVLLYQVKKRARGEWSRSDLCKKRRRDSGELNVKGKNLNAARAKSKRLAASSPLGKLYRSVVKLCDLWPTTGVFVSNAAMNVRLRNGDLVPTHSTVALSELQTGDLSHIENRIAKELGETPPLQHCRRLRLEQTRVSPAAMRETVRGLAHDFLSKRAPQSTHASGQLVERLINAFSDRSRHVPTLRLPEDVIRHKGFRRSEFVAILAEISSILPVQTRIENVLAGLVHENYLGSRAASQIRNAAYQIATLLVAQPSTKETYFWDVAIATARQVSELDQYSTVVETIRGQLANASEQNRQPPLRSEEITSIAILAIIHVDEPATPSARDKN